MIYDRKMDVYWRSPVCVQEAALSLYARRLDRLYYGTGYEELQKPFGNWPVSEGLCARIQQPPSPGQKA